MTTDGLVGLMGRRALNVGGVHEMIVEAAGRAGGVIHEPYAGPLEMLAARRIM